MKFIPIGLFLILAACAESKSGNLSSTDVAGMPRSNFNLASCIDDGPATDGENFHVYICQEGTTTPIIHCPVYVLNGQQHSPCGG